jgi:hypothetical protein
LINDFYGTIKIRNKLYAYRMNVLINNLIDLTNI